VTLQSVLAAGRRSAETLMTATCQITRKHLVSLDATSLLLSDTDPTDDLIYQGPCRIRALIARVQTGDFEGQLLGGQQMILWLPVSTSGKVTTGDEVEIIDGGDDPSVGRPVPTDPTVPGLQLRIQGRAVQTQATSHRFPVEVLS
jgi:hypothetical protein